MQVNRQATKETYIQYMVDTLTMTLNDPDIMGKDVFGKQRLNKVILAWGQKYEDFFKALVKDPEACYYQEKMDESLRKALGAEGFIPFERRYEWLKKQL